MTPKGPKTSDQQDLLVAISSLPEPQVSSILWCLWAQCIVRCLWLGNLELSGTGTIFNNQSQLDGFFSLNYPENLTTQRKSQESNGCGPCICSAKLQLPTIRFVWAWWVITLPLVAARRLGFGNGCAAAQMFNLCAMCLRFFGCTVFFEVLYCIHSVGCQYSKASWYRWTV